MSHVCLRGVGTGSTEAMLMPSVLGKWGKQQVFVSLPGLAAGGVQSLALNVTCYVRKVLW